ncbi:Mannose-6-phosphate isomerase [Pseudomonas chlororaphis subsp. aureofaciens]|uniref:Mannose-6-phosphate isomerase n=1 Tax=Pseudomonas chlororaphis subsp. aureofaciens TaxID=587851 RepID=A0AAD0ZEQ2_9PSED|nr:Mannose-6-phosphate isomerase [Pseudomonas chlororaphis subsp. aureofaciens]AZE21064.1 Mannose-6-phosphate isomerase [Pseudomonas chlororaphis subsp. aureofaciens]AZE27419.1 Mannose-6-phosphate isomerase [Pseudomonas chlororaphis subsp. aureofaciens]AZE33666.1 Mannose-6-phosphate isomerase [Pseudomonas chlororaphis subsp. aureofaciens]AZE40001.1 Mannose-6-phosphate isomerase [Pseudomonas chlororaphis subsp. aureofaciens]
MIVPLWQGPGWNPELALPFEALDAEHAPLPPQRYRAMACARQLYLFSSLIGDGRTPLAQERAAALFRSLQRHFHDAEHGGWFYSIDAQGTPLDRRKDLYTHAFIIFACAHYWAKVREPLVESVLNAALKVVAERFASGDGLYEAVLAEDWSSLASGPLQNPLMHLAEAFLATLAVRDDAAVQGALLALCEGMQQRFIEPQHGLMMEKPLGAVDNWFEPGHQFEWFFLLQSSPLLFGCPLHASLERAFAYAEQVGVDNHSGAVSGMLSVEGDVLDPTQRIWAQAEYLRALTLRQGSAERLQHQLRALQKHFLHAKGWNECLDAHGVLSRRDMPSTTPYHLATCYLGLAEYFG